MNDPLTFFPRLDANSGGYCNSITLVSRKGPSSTLKDEEPPSLLIRRKGGNMVDVDELALNTDASQTLIQYELSRRGLGPKLYGVFTGGTIEEYIDSHTLTSEESADPDISKDIALSLAAIHAIQGLPLKVTANEGMFEMMRKWAETIPNSRDYVKSNEKIKKYNLDLDFWHSFDYPGEIDWLENLLRTLPMRRSFIIYDMNYLNCLVRNDPKADQMRVVLIDYDLAHFDFRGLDLGIHFYARRLDVHAKEDKIIPGTEFPSDEEKRRFLRIYQQEIKRLNVFDDFDETGIDSIDNLLLESMIGQLQWTLHFGCYIMSKPEAFLEFEPAFAPLIDFMFRQYLLVKKDVLKIMNN